MSTRADNLGTVLGSGSRITGPRFRVAENLRAAPGSGRLVEVALIAEPTLAGGTSRLRYDWRYNGVRYDERCNEVDWRRIARLLETPPGFGGQS